MCCSAGNTGIRVIDANEDDNNILSCNLPHSAKSQKGLPPAGSRLALLLTQCSEDSCDAQRVAG